VFAVGAQKGEEMSGNKEENEEAKDRNADNREESGTRVVVVIGLAALVIIAILAVLGANLISNQGRAIAELTTNLGDLTDIVGSLADITSGLQTTTDDLRAQVDDLPTEADITEVISDTLTVLQPASESTPPDEPTTAVTTTVGAVPAPEVSLPPQPQKRHPTWYAETGKEDNGEPETITWEIDVIPGTTLIVGGYEVNGREGGVYKAWSEAQSVQVTVKNGFVLLIQNEWAEEEFCFRIGEAETYGWAHSFVEPLPGWTCQ
jgi:hypothetical protein